MSAEESVRAVATPGGLRPGAPGGLRPDAAPPALVPLVRGCAGVSPDEVPFRRQGSGRREAAVLVLLAGGGDGAARTRSTTDGPPDGVDVLLIERAAALRDHAGQAAFPGGAHDASDADLVVTALREAAEETGVDPGSVVPLCTLPPLTIPVTGFSVTPVIAHWAVPGTVGVVDPGEVAAVVRVPVAALTDPAARFTVVGPSGHTGPAFAVGGLLVWGFTAGVVSWLLDLAGWTRPWDAEDVRELDEVWRRRHELSRPLDGDDGGSGGGGGPDR